MANFQYKIINGTKGTLLLTVTKDEEVQQREKVTPGETQVLNTVAKDAKVHVKQRESLKKEGTVIIQFSPEVSESQFEFEFINKSDPGDVIGKSGGNE